jgi:ethanolamine utilization protein EutQ
MTQAAEGIRLFTKQDVETWHQSEERGVFLSDVVDDSNGNSMSVGFARYAPGESNEWVVTYDEALIVTDGAYTVTSADGTRTTAQAGDVIFLDKGTRVVYSAEETGAEVVYVTYPHWLNAQAASEHAGLLDTFHPADGARPPAVRASERENLAMMRRIWDPIERGESRYEPFFDALAEDVVFELPIGELRGRESVVAYFTDGGEAMEFNPFIEPLEYYAAGDRVVQVGNETFRVKETGVTHRARWAWVFEIHDGQITRIVAIQHLGEIAEEEAAVIARARSASPIG